MSFLDREIQRIASSPLSGTAVLEFAGVRRRLVKRRSRGHGHLVFYRVSGDRLEILHILHTAQDWRTRLDES